MKVSGKEVANAISKKLQKEIERYKLKPSLAIILAGDNPLSRIYVNNKIKQALQIGIQAKLFEFSQNQFNKCLQFIQKLNTDKRVHGIIVQYPVHEGWDFDSLVLRIDPKKDVDGFKKESSYSGATAMAVWEMLTAFSLLEGFEQTEEFLKKKKIVVLGKGKTAGRPTIKLLKKRGVEPLIVDSKTRNPNQITKSADVVISATGIKNIVNGSNIKKGAYVVGIGVGKEEIDGQQKIYGDVSDEQVSKKAKLYCPTIGGIGPLTIVSLLKNVVESAKKARS